ncbi:hypothetical protein FD754_013152 [Muntiacus muntjak]|uniref:Gamma-butyrobetaine,2-oxoglutarate dioxygenase n=1 Tax=Muntiacus muntjak TaxID=9888 RepID=A0A5N3VJ04_MUNMU|nr:hypothetical protein FD754_013152 [Muntiacus muntjak]
MDCIIQKAEVLDGAHLMRIIWQDGTDSIYPAVWLRDNCQCPDCYLDSAKARKLLIEALDVYIGIKDLMFDRKKCQYWGSEFQLPTLDFEDVLKDDEHAYRWLSSLKKVGIVRLTGAADKRGEVQLLHCIKQTVTGGESEIVDGFNVCQKLKEKNPRAFQILSSTFVDFTDIGVDYCDFSVQSKHKIIELDDKDQVVRINFNNATRDTIFDVPVERVQPFYAALKEFVDLMNCKDFKVTFKMNPGDVITFDNWRLLHGRRSYEAGTEISRHLEGAYADWDVVMSRLRILRQSVQNRN